MSDAPSSKAPNIYIDSPILIDVLKNRRTASLELLEQARLKDWLISTSQFAVMELLDVEQDDRFFILEVAKGRNERLLKRE